MVVQSRGAAGGAGSSSRASGAAARVGDHPVIEAGARAGYVVSGVLHLLIAWLGLQVAFGDSGANADPSGALTMVAASPVGGVLMIAVITAFVLLAVWQSTEAVRVSKTADRAKAIAKALTYLALSGAALSLVRGAGESGASQAKDATAALMDLPFGPILVVVAGIAIAGVGGYHIYKGWAQKFREDLATSPSRFVVNAGRVGYIAKGVALIGVGLGLVTAGLQHKPSQSKGLDGVLHDMVSLPLGQVLVAVISLGFAAYGIYSFGRARNARL